MDSFSDNITRTEILATITISQIRSLLYVSVNCLHFLAMFACFVVAVVVIVANVITKGKQQLLTQHNYDIHAQTNTLFQKIKGRHKM